MACRVLISKFPCGTDETELPVLTSWLWPVLWREGQRQRKGPEKPHRLQRMVDLSQWQHKDKIQVLIWGPFLTLLMSSCLFNLYAEWKWKSLSHVRLFVTILGWVAFPFSRGPSQPRDRTGVSCIAGRFFTSWAIGKAHMQSISCKMPRWMKLKKESRLLGEISITLDMQIIPPL